MSKRRFLTRVRLRNYKNIARCQVELAALTFVVGPNGAGKSNFLDALRFVADALRGSLDHAVRERGGISEVRRRSNGHPHDFSIRLDYELPSGAGGHYAFRIGAQERLGFVVKDEECVISGPDPLERWEYLVREGELVHVTGGSAPAVSVDRLYLVNASGVPAFRDVYEAVSRMGFYNLEPAALRDLQAPDAGDLLRRDGGNLASVIERLRAEDPGALDRIEQFLGGIVPGIRAVDSVGVGPRQTVAFRQDVAGARDPWRFQAASMSDGTLRALGILVALFQSPHGRRDGGASLVGIEEPEIALHPGATRALLDALREASLTRQVLVTSHSPDLLDEVGLEDGEAVLAVESDRGDARIAPLGPAEREVLRRRLYTIGELLRQDQLTPDPDAIPRDARQMTFFEVSPNGGE